MSNSILRLFLGIILCMLVPSIAYGYAANSGTRAAVTRTKVVALQSTNVNTWSLPDPTFMASTFSGSTWYNEYNPTRRRTVYDDGRINPYGFVTLRDDWPIATDETVSERYDRDETDQRNRRRPFVNPLRFVAKRIRTTVENSRREG